MTTTDSKQVAERFFKAWTTGDFETARSLVHDNMSFSGPIDTFDNAAAYIGSLQGLSHIIKAADKRKVFVDGNDVCVIYDLVTNTPIPPSPTAEWYHLRNGKISAVRVFFDARPFAPMFEKQA